MSELSWQYHHHPALLMRDYGSTYTKDNLVMSTAYSLVLVWCMQVIRSQSGWNNPGETLKSIDEWLGEPAEPLSEGLEM